MIIQDNKLYLEHRDIHDMCVKVAKKSKNHVCCFPVPRGGIPAAYMLSSMTRMSIVDSPEEADFILDDIVDSGATRDHFKTAFPNLPFYALVDKTDPGSHFKSHRDKWVVFPWEHNPTAGESTPESEDAICTRLLQFIGEDVTREGLLETPGRWLRAWQHWAGGYHTDFTQLFKVFEDGSESYDEMIVVRDIPFYSHCEHHLAPFFGTVTFGYLPDGYIVGLSKINRLVDAFARRLQVQERLTTDIVNTAAELLEPQGVGCIVKARHLCMESRGIAQQGHHTITSSMQGKFRDDPKVRAEFMALVR